jgi:hypothetical protein
MATLAQFNGQVVRQPHYAVGGSLAWLDVPEEGVAGAVKPEVEEGEPRRACIRQRGAEIVDRHAREHLVAVDVVGSINVDRSLICVKCAVGAVWFAVVFPDCARRTATVGCVPVPREMRPHGWIAGQESGPVA